MDDRAVEAAVLRVIEATSLMEELVARLAALGLAGVGDDEAQAALLMAERSLELRRARLAALLGVANEP